MKAGSTMSYNHLSIQERELARNPGEYFPKDYDFSKLSDDDLQAVVDQFNHRPRKCLGYKTSWELWFSQPLHLA